GQCSVQVAEEHIERKLVLSVCSFLSKGISGHSPSLRTQDRSSSRNLKEKRWRNVLC
ncbi:hypothetical protein LEMLEM_LOCUS23601, partial [Lemmus lemmus]